MTPAVCPGLSLTSASRQRIVFLSLLGILSVGVLDAAAQRDGFIAVGAGFIGRASQQADVRDAHSPAFIVRLGARGDGWGVRYGFNWYSTTLDRSVGRESISFGRLRVRPLLVGYGYTLRRGHARVSFNLKAGYAFTSFRLQPASPAAYQSSPQPRPVRADASNALALKPEVDTWIDLSRKLGLNISTGYMRARPVLAVTSDGGSDRQRIQADMFLFQVGMVYSIF